MYNEAPGRALPSSPESASESLSWKSGWDDLIKQTAPNALYNSSVRFDAPKCDDDTRVGVIEEIMGWVTDREAPTKMLCMTGAAGAGKSCLQQSIAERCQEAGILASSFFFWTGDPTRNNVMGIAATMAYQVGLENMELRALIGAAVERDPLIFMRSLAVQVATLIVVPVKRFRAKAGDQAARSLPYVILIDGLDECENSDRQLELLSVLKTSFLDNDDSPFRIFIASRPEWAVRSALEPQSGFLHGLAYHIRLSDKYDASEDIRRMLWRRLREVGARSGDSRAGPNVWPTEEDIALIVAAASGQFIYAAVVVKYVSERRGSPVDRLRTVLTWRPSEDQRTAPFAALDLLYENILSHAKAAYDEVDTNAYEFILLFRAYRFLCQREQFSAQTLEMSDTIFGLPEGTWKLVISDLHSVVTAREDEGAGGHSFFFYHKSFEDFLGSPHRTKVYISQTVLNSFMVDRLMRYVSPETPYPTLGGTARLGVLTQLSICLETLLQAATDHSQASDQLPLAYFVLNEFTRTNGWNALKAGLCRFESTEGLSADDLTLLRRSASICLWIGSITFERIYPTLTGIDQNDISLGATVQRWMFSVFSESHSYIYAEPFDEKGKGHITELYLEEPPVMVVSTSSVPSLAVGRQLWWWRSSFKPACKKLFGDIISLIPLQNRLVFSAIGSTSQSPVRCSMKLFPEHFHPGPSSRGLQPSSADVLGSGQVCGSSCGVPPRLWECDHHGDARLYFGSPCRAGLKSATRSVNPLQQHILTLFRHLE